jgi:hypothetical protein
MIPHIGNNESYFKGYIYNVATESIDHDNNPLTPLEPVEVTTAALDDMNISELGPLGPNNPDRIVNNTAPFYFYFGLIKGSSAYDRFLTKWVKKDTNKY